MPFQASKKSKKIIKLQVNSKAWSPYVTSAMFGLMLRFLCGTGPRKRYQRVRYKPEALRSLERRAFLRSPAFYIANFDFIFTCYFVYKCNIGKNLTKYTREASMITEKIKCSRLDSLFSNFQWESDKKRIILFFINIWMLGSMYRWSIVELVSWSKSHQS